MPFPTLISSELSKRLDWFYQLQRHGIKLGLEHTFALLQKTQNPQNELSMIHVAGTNGKGSTCTLIANILKCAGKKVGLYTSPHLVRFNERIRINGNPISNDDIVTFLDKTESHILEIESTFFEATTVMALDYFRNNEVDVAVIETGLGGRLDSTNVIHPTLTVMTPISMDHMDILGNTLEIIAREKAGIIKEQVPLVTAQQQSEVSFILNETASQKNSRIKEIDSPTNITLNEKGTQFQLLGKSYSTPLIGLHQAMNATLAIQAVQQFDSSILDDSIEEGLKTVQWPGRIQQLSHNIFYDVAHNEDGLNTLIQTIKTVFPTKTIHGIFGLKGDKDLRRLAGKMIGNIDQIITVQDNHELLLDAKFVSDQLNQFGLLSAPSESIDEAINKVKHWRDSGCVCIIFGSHYIAEEVFKHFEIPFDAGII